MRIVALRHVASEDLGVWASTIRARGHQVEYLDAGDDISRGRTADLLIVLGAPLSISDTADYPYLADEQELVAFRLYEDRPGFHAVAVDVEGRERPEWAEILVRRPLRSRRVKTETWTTQPGWPQLNPRP